MESPHLSFAFFLKSLKYRPFSLSKKVLPSISFAEPVEVRTKNFPVEFAVVGFFCYICSINVFKQVRP